MKTQELYEPLIRDFFLRFPFDVGIESNGRWDSKGFRIRCVMMTDNESQFGWQYSPLFSPGHLRIFVDPVASELLWYWILSLDNTKSVREASFVICLHFIMQILGAHPNMTNMTDTLSKW